MLTFTPLTKESRGAQTSTNAIWTSFGVVSLRVSVPILALKTPCPGMTLASGKNGIIGYPSFDSTD